MALLRLGRIIKFIPDTVIAGFTSGIGVITSRTRVSPKSKSGAGAVTVRRMATMAMPAAANGALRRRGLPNPKRDARDHFLAEAVLQPIENFLPPIADNF